LLQFAGDDQVSLEVFLQIAGDDQVSLEMLLQIVGDVQVLLDAFLRFAGGKCVFFGIVPQRRQGIQKEPHTPTTCCSPIGLLKKFCYTRVRVI
ncbi:MAG: hypothetical protein LBQ70_03515, partial [Prevotellaceae bacterium]|nr:hypothetical protein [Prevotellaceae bacterium]